MAPSAGRDPVGGSGGARLNDSRFRAPAFIPIVTALAVVAPFQTLAEAPEEGDSTRPQAAVEALKKLSVEELMELRVTSVSKRSEPLSDAPASIFVISAADIRRSGVTTLPEALRLAPNLQVARRDSVQYAISARGFNNAIGNKLLVLIDGRTIYTPLFSGVFWEQQDVMLEDVDRIEVISGPGGTLWGANAVNGVINVITRSASETQGPLLAGGAGDTEWGAALRYGGTLGSQASYRVYGKFSTWDSTRNAAGAELVDEWQRGQAGFRADWSNANDAFTLQGDAYSGQSQHRGVSGPFELTPVEVSGFNVLGRWNRQLADGADLQLQAYFDHARRDDIVLFRPDADIFDVELQHAIPLDRHRILWGGGYRRARDEVSAGLLFGFIPSGRRLEWENLFIEDEFRLSERIGVTFGVKLESNDYTGWEYLPSARLAWKPRADRLVWMALSRAVRAPSRLDREIFLPPNPPFVVAGGPAFQSEVSHVAELGYRARASSAVSYSISAFYHDWDEIRSGTAPPVIIENRIEGEVYGAEIWGTYEAARFWRLSAGLTWLDEDLRLESGSTDPVGTANPNLRNDPDYQWLLRSSFDLPAGVELDLFLRGVGALPNPSVPDYTELDVRLAWLPVSSLELSVVGRDLLHDRHAEFGALPGRGEIERSVLGQVRWRF